MPLQVMSDGKVKHFRHSKCAIAVCIAVIVGLVAACTGFALKVTQLQSEINFLTSQQQQVFKEVKDRQDSISMQVAKHDHVISQLQRVLSATSDNITTRMTILQQALNFVSDRLDNTTEQVTRDYSSQIHELNLSLQQLNETVLILAATSCAGLPPSSPSGYYWVRASDGSAVRVYCDMTRSCGGVTGGWMRVAQLDMTNTSHQCPSPLRESTQSNIRTCVRNKSRGGCSSTMLPTAKIHYRSVCGKIIAYQFGQTEAFYAIYNIDSQYVDGVSLTHGTPKEHIWTFAAARDEVLSGHTSSSCPCIRDNEEDISSFNIPPFVGNNYFCDTGSESTAQNTFYSEDPLWDGAGCGPESTCCSFNTPPWFYRQLSHTTTDDIEMRVCRTVLADDEDINIEMVEIYVQ